MKTLAILLICVAATSCQRDERWYPVDNSDELHARYPIEDEEYRGSPFVSERRYADPFQENDMVPNFYEEIDENVKERITGYENVPEVFPTPKEVTTSSTTTGPTKSDASTTTAGPITTELPKSSSMNSTDQVRPGNLTQNSQKMKSKILDKDFEDYLQMKEQEDPLWFIKRRRHHNKNVNINHNSNVNTNSNHNSNTNVNINHNSNHNSNVNINSNHNSNTNINSNHNSNTNVNQNSFRPLYIDNLPKQWHICGGYIIDQFSQLCCQGNPVNKQPFSKCCGSELYNLITEDCVSGSPVAKKLPECGSSNTTYDAFKQFCYHGDVYTYEKYIECDGSLYYV